MADTKISALATKAVPVGTDITNILDSAAANADKKVTLATLPISTATQTALDGKQNAYGAGDVTAFVGTAKEIELGDRLIASTSTAVESGGALSINADPTKYDISAVQARHVDYAGNLFDTITETAKLANIPTLTGVVYIYLDPAGNIVETNTAPTPESRRDDIFLGRIVVSGGTVIAAVSYPVINLQVASQVYDLISSIGIVNIEGNVASANGANLSLNKSSGYLLIPGINFVNNIKDPHRLLIAAGSPITFQHMTQTAATGSDVTVISPTNYDLGGTITAYAGVNNKATNMRVYLFPSGSVRIQYGQTIYNSLSAAAAGVASTAYIVNPSVPGNGILIGVLSVTKGCTSLNNAATALFTSVSKFGEAVGGAAGGSSTSTFQNVYVNSTPNPEILTDSTNGALTLRRGSAADTDNVFEVQNGAGTITTSIKGDGLLYSAAIVYKSMPSSTPQTTTLDTATDVTGINFAVGANEVWNFVVDIQNGCNNTGGVKYAVTFPTGSTSRINFRGTSSGVTGVTSSVTATSGALSGVAFNTISSQGGWSVVSGTVRTAGTAGTVQLQFASGVATQTSTVHIAQLEAKRTA